MKDEDSADPPITGEALDILGLLTDEECKKIKELTREICGLVLLIFQ